VNSQSLTNQERSIATIVAEIKQEAKHFVQTRMALFKEEMQAKVTRMVSAMPLLASGVLLLGTAWLLLNVALVSFLATVLEPSRHSLVFSLLIVGFAWTVISLLLLYKGMRMANPAALIPEKTIEILKEDNLWLKKQPGGI